jgi:tetratricopeptide (TPR) repeat protein
MMQIKAAAGMLLGLLLVSGCASTKEANNYYMSGTQMYNADNFDAAIENFNRAIELRSDQASFYEKRGLAREKKGDLGGAIADYDSAARLEPENSDYYELAVRAKINNKNYESAIRDLNKLVLIKPKYSNYMLLGQLVHEKKDLDRAIAAYDRAIQLEPDGSFAYFLRGIAHKDKGDDMSALADHDKALQVNRGKGLYVYYFELAQWKYKIGSMEDTIRYSTEVIRLNSKAFNAYIIRALAKKAIGDENGFREDEKTYYKLKKESIDLKKTYH